jgi:hypothetical protein
MFTSQIDYNNMCPVCVPLTPPGAGAPLAGGAAPPPKNTLYQLISNPVLSSLFLN